MRPLLLYMFSVGILLAIYNGFESTVIVSAVPTLTSDAQDEISAVIFLVEGAMTVVASFAAGKLADVIRRKTVLVIFSIIGALSIGLSLVCYIQANLVFAYLMACAWGMAYSGGYTLLPIVMAKDFNGSVESFSIVQFTSNFASAIGFFLCIYVKNIPTFLIITGAILVLTFISTCFYKQKEDKKTRAIEEDTY